MVDNEDQPVFARNNNSRVSKHEDVYCFTLVPISWPKWKVVKLWNCRHVSSRPEFLGRGSTRDGRGEHSTGCKTEVLKQGKVSFTFHTFLKMTRKLWGLAETFSEGKMKFNIVQGKVEIKGENKMVSCLYPYLRLRACSTQNSRRLLTCICVFIASC